MALNQVQAIQDYIRPGGGILIAVEGIDGSGKSTACKFIQRLLRAYPSITPLLTSDLKGTEVGFQVRNIITKCSGIAPEVELLLIQAARLQHIRKIIEPALLEGRVVITDRFTLTTVAYQGIGKGLGANCCHPPYNLKAKPPQPDITFVMDAPVCVAMERIQAREVAPDAFETLGVDFFERVANYFRRAAQLNKPNGKIKFGDHILVDGSGDQEQTFQVIRKHLMDYLSARGLTPTITEANHDPEYKAYY